MDEFGQEDDAAFPSLASDVNTEHDTSGQSSGDTPETPMPHVGDGYISLVGDDPRPGPSPPLQVNAGTGGGGGAHGGGAHAIELQLDRDGIIHAVGPQHTTTGTRDSMYVSCSSQL